MSSNIKYLQVILGSVRNCRLAGQTGGAKSKTAATSRVTAAVEPAAMGHCRPSASRSRRATRSLTAASCAPWRTCSTQRRGGCFQRSLHGAQPAIEARPADGHGHQQPAKGDDVAEVDGEIEARAGHRPCPSLSFSSLPISVSPRPSMAVRANSCTALAVPRGSSRSSACLPSSVTICGFTVAM